MYLIWSIGQCQVVIETHAFVTSLITLHKIVEGGTYVFSLGGGWGWMALVGREVLIEEFGIRKVICLCY